MLNFVQQGRILVMAEICEAAMAVIGRYLCSYFDPVGETVAPPNVVKIHLFASAGRASDLGFRPRFFGATNGGGAMRNERSSPTDQT